jgi:NADH dehydrogenase [ubiquinone] 1 alpha subcomplex assembly factor 7
MQLALGDPEHGYYMRADPIGRDFITAPEVSQIFGELIGLLFMQAWEDRGRSQRFHLVELGPGRGTLMGDMLRAAKIRPAFLAGAHVSLVETSPALCAIQARTMEGARVEWRNHLAEVPQDAPLFLVANEFFDALPARQFVRGERGWHERMVTVESDRLVFALAPGPMPFDIIPASLRDAPLGSVFETSPASQAIVSGVARRVTEQDGLALIIDYGHSQMSLGDSFQAVKENRYADPLSEPGEADLTFHVDFTALAGAATDAGARVCGPQTQAAFLNAVGIGPRAGRLRQGAPEQADEINAAVNRLTDPMQMGSLFKIMAICERDGPGVPGFSC